MKNHVIVDCERMKYPNTGIYYYCLQLGRNLLANTTNGKNKFSFFSPPNANTIFGNQSNYIHQHAIHKLIMPPLKQYNIWHATYQNTAYLPKRNQRIKVVLTIHDLNFLYDNRKSSQKKQRYLAHLQKNIERSDAIICISDFTKKDVLENCNIGNKHIHMIHNGTNTLHEPVLFSHSYKPIGKFIFSIGVIAPKKNFHALFPLLENNDMELLIAGRLEDSSYFNFLIVEAKKHGVEKRLHILGEISETEKSWYFKNCYAFSSPSVAEGFCMPVTEAMSVGKPLFLSNQTALPEIGGKVAFYFSNFERSNMQNVFLNGMQEYTNTNMHDAIIQRGSTFCWDKTAQLYLQVYESL
jgi:glycosyltransferase involved in cell wall biosynthesis